MDIDALYAGFCSTLPPALREIATELPFRLGLCPVREPSWSRIFSHDVTLAAPVFVAEALPRTGRAAVRQATLAHLLAVVHGFTVDRLEDGQAPRTRELEDLAVHLARGRDAALTPLTRQATDLYTAAENAMRQAISQEQVVLRDGDAVAFDRYLALSLDKQRIGFVASVALAESEGGPEMARLVERMLAQVALALQLEDDVVDWQDDFARGGAWAVCLARALRKSSPAPERRTEPSPIVMLVHASGVLAYMMRNSEQRLAKASDIARRIGASRLGIWAEQRAMRACQLAGREEEHPGYTLRARHLAPWASEVLR